jgi:hypothetical protein
MEYPLGIYRPKPFLPGANKLLLNKPSHEPTIRCLVKATSYTEHIPAPLLISGHLKKAKMQHCKDDDAYDLCDTGDVLKVRLGTVNCDAKADLEENREVGILTMWDHMQVYSRDGLGLVIVPSG